MGVERGKGFVVRSIISVKLFSEESFIWVGMGIRIRDPR